MMKLWSPLPWAAGLPPVSENDNCRRPYIVTPAAARVARAKEALRRRKEFRLV
jgi:hypothetical protein